MIPTVIEHCDLVATLRKNPPQIAPEAAIEAVQH